MTPSYFQDKYASKKEQQILKQINDINDKLNRCKAKEIAKTINTNYQMQHQLKKKKPLNQDFQDECDILFPNEVRPSTCNYYTFENDNDSLFGNSQQQMLIDNELNKQIKYFKQFQTNKNSEKSNQSSKAVTTTTFKSKLNKEISQKNLTQLKNNNKSSTPQEVQILNLRKYGQKIVREARKNNFYNKNLNKQNQLPFNKSRGKRFQTMPDCATVLQDQKEYEQDQYLQFAQQQFEESDSLEVDMAKDKKRRMLKLKKQRSKQRQSLYKQKNSRNYNKNNCDVNSSSANNSLECTFKPSILKRSVDIAKQLKPSFQRLTEVSSGLLNKSRQKQKNPYKAQSQLQNIKKYSVDRLEQLSQPRKAKTKTLAQVQQQLPSFRPNLSKKSLQQMQNCTLDVASRNKMWLQQKQAKIAKMKQEQQQMKLKKQEGSYMPKTNNYKGQQQVHLSRFAKEGIACYFQRISIAKQKNSIYANQKKQTPASNKCNNQSSSVIEAKTKKKSYNQAVQELHNKILQMKI